MSDVIMKSFAPQEGPAGTVVIVEVNAGDIVGPLGVLDIDEATFTSSTEGDELSCSAEILDDQNYTSFMMVAPDGVSFPGRYTLTINLSGNGKEWTIVSREGDYFTATED